MSKGMEMGQGIQTPHPKKMSTFQVSIPDPALYNQV